MQDISETDAVKEGFDGWDDDVTGGCTAFGEFSQTWCGIYGEESWNRNDWVWVIDFEVIRQNVDEYLREQECANKHEPVLAAPICSLSQLTTHGGDLWCDDCWHGLDKDTETGIEYTDLPQFIPEADLKMQALTEGLQAIKKHMEIMGAGNLGARMPH